MQWWASALLGLVQGATEFLPISSSGHLVLMEALLGVSQEGILFEVAVHLATLAAVVAFYRRRVLELVVGVARGSPEALRYVAKLALATLPAVTAALVARAFFESLYEDPAVVGVALLLTGSLVFTMRRTSVRAQLDEPGWVAAFAIGCAQAVAIVPGVSRSGATVAVALALGMTPVRAAEFSFLMSVIAILGASVLQLPRFEAASGAALGEIALGGLVALVSGFLALALFVRLLRGRSAYRFAYYAWGLGGVVIVWQLLDA